MRKRIFMGLLAVGSCSLLLQGDTLRMRNGQVYHGSFAGGDGNSIQFTRDNGRTETFSRGDIDSLVFSGDGESGTYRRPLSGANGGYDPNMPPPRTNGAYDPNYPQRTGNAYPPANPGNSNFPRRADEPYTRDNRDAYPPPSTASTYPEGRGGGLDAYGRPVRVPTAGTADRAAYGNGVLPAGTVITVRTLDRIDSDATQVGTTYNATLDQPIVVNGQTIAPVGNNATLQVVRLRQGGHFTGREEVSLALSGFTDANGVVHPLTTSDETVQSSSRGRQTGEYVGGGAALGAILGAIAGGGAGAAIGAASGAALGAGVQVLRGVNVKVAPETRISFTLAQDIPIS